MPLIAFTISDMMAKNDSLIKATMAYFNAFFDGELDSFTTHAVLVAIIAAAEIGLAIGIWLESPKDKKFREWLGLTLVLGGCVFSVIATVLLLIFDEGISRGQKTRIDAQQSQLVTAIDRASDAEFDAAQANNAAAIANAHAAQLENENLRIREAISPRLLEQGAPARALAQFKGTKAFVTSVPEFEARDFAKFLGITLQMAEWNVTFMPSRDDLFDGITVEFISGPQYHPGANGPPTEYNAALRGAAEALIAELTKQDFKASPGRWGAVDPERVAARLGIPTDAMRIGVGLKPLPEFVRNKLFEGGRPGIYRSGPPVTLPP